MNTIPSPEDCRPAPEGWVLRPLNHTFGTRAGPFYMRDPEGDVPGIGFFAEPHHGNLEGAVHGGALLTLADMALFDIAFRTLGRFTGVTVTLNADFLNPGPVGQFIEATGEIVKNGRSLIFARGTVTEAGTPLLSFSGAIKRLS